MSWSSDFFFFHLRIYMEKILDVKYVIKIIFIVFSRVLHKSFARKHQLFVSCKLVFLGKDKNWSSKTHLKYSLKINLLKIKYWLVISVIPVINHSEDFTKKFCKKTNNFSRGFSFVWETNPSKNGRLMILHWINE